MTVTFNIRNVTNGIKNTVMLRKFFQMVFVGNDRRSLHIYTATVLGGLPKHIDEGDTKDFISSLDSFNKFCLQFGFIVTGNDNNDVLSIKNEDATEGEGGFLEQIDCIQRVWGKQCKIIFGDQGDLQNHLKQLLKNKDKCSDSSAEEQDILEDKGAEEKNKEILAKMARNRTLWIEDTNKDSNEGLMNSIAIPGKCWSEDYTPPPKNQQKAPKSDMVDEGSEKAFYYIAIPDEQECCRGVELLNWVKTTIVFKHRLNDPNLNFCIKKEPDSNTFFMGPDFTWYFSPPVKSYINHESSSVEASWKRKDQQVCERHDKCQCPIKPDATTQYTSKRYDNAINPVANKTTVNFRRWVDDEMISYRQKYRIAARNILPRPELIDDIRELNIFIDTSDEHNRGNRQYVLGIFISFALAFGIDKTRLQGAEKYFPLKDWLVADTWWLLLIIVLSLNLLIRPPRNIEETSYRKYIGWRKWNILCALGWIIVVFCLDQSQRIKTWCFNLVGIRIVDFVNSLLCVNFDFYWIPEGIFLLILGSNLIYIYRNIKKYHDPILSGIFGDDIL